MHNWLNYLSLFFFVFSLLGTIKLIFNFLSSMLSTPPKPFEMTNLETITYGVFLSYLLTYIIYLLA
jgi:hypothetical protein